MPVVDLPTVSLPVGDVPQNDETASSNLKSASVRPIALVPRAGQCLKADGDSAAARGFYVGARPRKHHQKIH
jgi:hypothetical protein